MRVTAACLVLGVCLGARADEPAAPAAPVVLCDFETGEPTDGWTAKGLAVSEVETPHGRGLKLAAAGNTSADTVGSIERESPVADWRTFRAVTLRARAEGTQPVAMRLLAIRRDGAGRRLRRFTVEPGEWRDVVLDLADFRDDGGDEAGTFADVGRILLRWDKGAGEVTIDDVALVPGDRGPLSSTRTPESWTRLVFREAMSQRIESDHFLLLHDVAALTAEDAKRLLGRLEDGLALLADRYGVKGEFGDKVPFVVFASREEFEAFVPRLGRHLGAIVEAPKAAGFSIFGVGMSSWDPKLGWDRPVFVHEAMHGAIQRLLLVGSNGNWIQEGLASAVQARLHPASLDRAKLAKEFAARSLAPWSKLFAEPCVPLSSYSEILAIMDFLAETRRAELPKVWDAVRACKEPLHAAAPKAIAAALGTDVEKLEEEWLAWGATFYAEKPK